MRELTESELHAVSGGGKKVSKNVHKSVLKKTVVVKSATSASATASVKSVVVQHNGELVYSSTT